MIFRQDPLVQYQLHEIKAALKLDRMVGWRTLVSTRGNRRRMVVIVALAFFSQVGSQTSIAGRALIDCNQQFLLQWSGNGLVAYCAQMILDFECGQN